MTTTNTAVKWLLSITLVTASAMLAAQDDQQESTERAELRQQIQQARAEMAEAARRMARLQRQLGAGDRHVEIVRLGDDAETGSAPHASVLFGEDGEFAWRKLPPRLGVLLGGPGSGSANEVIGLTPGGGAEAAGIAQGDRLISVNDQAVTEGAPESIRDALEEVEAGTKVPVIVERGGQRMTFDVETTSVVPDARLFGLHTAPDLGEFQREIVIMRPNGPRTGNGPMPPHPPFAPGAPLFSVLGHDSDLISNHAGLEPYFGTAEGVVVLRIDSQNGFGLRDGDVVLRLDDEPVDRPVDLGRLLLGGEAGEQVVFEVMREGVLTQIPATIPERSGSVHRFPMRFEFKTAPTTPDAPRPPQPL